MFNLRLHMISFIAFPALILGTLLTPAGSVAAPVSIPELHDSATVRRDSHGVPHITANNEPDLILLQGWVHARDRLFQMDVLRRIANGTLAELVGPTALASDVELRTLGLRRAAERSLPLLSAEVRAALEAYAVGVNRYAGVSPLPIEYGALERTAFTPWTELDSLAVAKLLALDLSLDIDIGATLTLLTYVLTGQAVGIDGTALYFVDTHRAAPFDPAATRPDAMDPTRPGRRQAGAPSFTGVQLRDAVLNLNPATLRLAKNYVSRVQKIPLLRNALKPGKRIRGSNAWVVHGRHTQSGSPILANDPHLALGAPATFYPIHLRADHAGFNVSGESFPGVPYILLGQNRRIVWGATTNPMDVTDTFQERIVIDPNSPSNLSIVHRGNNEPIVPLPQQFKYNLVGDAVPDNLVTATPGGTVNGTFIPPVVLIVPRRNNGPIVDLDVPHGVGLSIQYAGFSGTREIDAFRRFNLAGNQNEFVDGLQYFDVGSQNFFYGDRDGTIAWFTSGELPLREDLQAATVNGLPPFFIRDGEGGNEWLAAAATDPQQSLPYAILPFREMPKIVNPPAGIIANANNDPTGATLDNDPLNQLRPGGGILYLNHGYSIGLRAGRITRQLRDMATTAPLGVDDTKKLQGDIVLPDAQYFVPFILSAFDNPEAVALAVDMGAAPRVAEAVGRLAAWDRSAPTGIAEGYDFIDVDGVLATPSASEIDSSVAATIFAAWRSQFVQNAMDAPLAGLGLPFPDGKHALAALRHRLDRFGTDGGVGSSGITFFPFPGAGDPAVRRDAVILKSLIESLDMLAGGSFNPVFGGSAVQDDYRWGLLHRVELPHLLGSPFSIPPAGGAFPPPLPGISGIPVDGGLGAIDRSDHTVRVSGSDDFVFSDGPVRRFIGAVGHASDAVSGQTSLPGGASGVLGSPYFVNLLPAWLTNDTYPVLRDDSEISASAVETVSFTP